MRVLAINQFYAPDHSATSHLLTDLCEDLVAAGHQATVIASPGGYLGGPKLAPREAIHGVEVIRPWATSLGKRTLAHRLTDYATFWTSSVARATIAVRPDVILVLTTPPLIAVGAALVAAARRIPLVSWVQDVYPDLAIHLGMLPAGTLASAPLTALSRATDRASRFIVALSDGMAERLAARGAARKNLRVIPNWADGNLLYPVPRHANSFLRAHHLQDRFIVMYSGNLGVGHDVATLVEAARQLESRCPRVLFLFVGDGARRKEAEDLAKGLSNVRFQPYQPLEQLAESLSAADVQIVTLREGLQGLLVPSKFYGAIACGRPVFYIGPADCEIARAIRADDLGWTGALGDASALARCIEAASRTPCWTDGRQDRIRAVFRARFDRTIATNKWRETLDEAAAPTSARA
jgi:colanic acid biosynthesis glycosyl transferase WcaI